MRFSAEAKFGPGHLFVTDGVAHGLPEAAREARSTLRHALAIHAAAKPPSHLASMKDEATVMCWSFTQKRVRNALWPRAHVFRYTY